MVFQKRSNFGFNGFQIPAMPRGFRSARGRRFVRRTAEENQMYAFELLATVAGKLSQEDDTIKSPPLKDVVQLDEVKKKRFEKEPCDQGSCDEGTLIWKYSKPHAKEFSQESTPIVLEKMSPRQESKVESSLEFNRTKAESGFGAQFQVKKKGGNWSCKTTGAYFLEEDHMDLYAKPSLLASSGSSVEVPLCRKHAFHTSVPMFGNDMELLHHDEEKSSGSTQPSTITSKTFRSQPIVDKRIKKISASKFWKVGPTLLMDGNFYSNESVKKSMFRSRKMYCTRQRTQRSFKRRKLISRSPMPSGVGINSETLVNFTSHGEKSFSDENLSGENDNWSSLTGQKSYKSEDYRVKFKVKSLKVPELFIELPKTATVGSLKKTVLESVTTLLENGLRVGVIFQGKKVRDDSKTLQQAGICHEDELSSLGFKLEPKTPQATKQQLSYHEKSHLPPGPESPQPLARIPPFPTQDSMLAISNFPDDSRGELLNTLVDHPSQRDDSNSHFSPTPTIFNPSSPDKPILTSKELVDVPIPSADNEMFAVVPSSKGRELVQRRIRRPFSVAEVEALVKAVEDLGTGRWRDVKIRAFEDAMHRTYVDLKDKWKTLVHTARISPHQRRGEPVPQELLDRVLSAHAHWSHQQDKAQAKPLQLTQLAKEGYTTDSLTDIVTPIVHRTVEGRND